MTRRCVASWLAIVSMLALGARGEPAPCLVSAAAPARAFVGEQIVLRIRILRRPDVSAATWLDAPALPGLRSDALPGTGGETRVVEQGAAYLVFEERRALFPVRAGRLEIGPSRLRCTLHSLPGEPALGFVATLAPLSVEAVMPPEQGRPEGWTGLVGSVRVETRAEPRHVVLGDGLHVEVVLEGEADLRDAPVPFSDARELGLGAELFAARPRLTTDSGDRLRLQRSHSFELVPREAGRLTLPEIRIPWFDPRTRRYEVAVSAAVEVRVDPAGGG